MAKRGTGGPKRRRTAQPSRVDAAYEALKAAIRDNRLAPGHQASEQELADRLGMSRTPVHEAVIRLQEEGLVRVLARRGVLVRALSPEDMREIYEVIVALESAAAAGIAAQPAPAREAAAQALAAENDAMGAALAADDLPAWAAADGRFHELLVARCGNARLARLLGTVMDQSHRARMLTLRLRPRPLRSVEEHRAIIAAIRAGDGAAAAALAGAHRRRAQEELLPLLGTLGMRHL
ncbi:MAG: GntR family transcriptional regulator [Rubritepida sp.]|nr:GntR family transcriptional regulator [Rubritepida sp.]